MRSVKIWPKLRIFKCKYAPYKIGREEQQSRICKCISTENPLSAVKRPNESNLHNNCNPNGFSSSELELQKPFDFTMTWHQWSHTTTKSCSSRTEVDHASTERWGCLICTWLRSAIISWIYCTHNCTNSKSVEQYFTPGFLWWLASNTAVHYCCEVEWTLMFRHLELQFMFALPPLHGSFQLLHLTYRPIKGARGTRLSHASCLQIQLLPSPTCRLLWREIKSCSSSGISLCMCIYVNDKWITIN